MRAVNGKLIIQLEWPKVGHASARLGPIAMDRKQTGRLYSCYDNVTGLQHLAILSTIQLDSQYIYLVKKDLFC